MTRGQITILPLAEHQYLGQNCVIIHPQKWVLGWSKAARDTDAWNLILKKAKDMHGQ